ncbi:U3 small nucleolar RNA-associated protein 15 [Spathaspora sp. JA1]|nr:U3 small nucleolar RNA-associated protein 15 [Spathaspora sp. JA1]
MSASRQGIPQVRNPTLPSQTTPEQRYWRSYVSPQLIKENHPVNCIDFNPITPNDFAITSSTRIQIFSSKTRQVIKTFSRFKDIVYSGNFRYDGKLLVAADATGLVSIYDSYQPRNLLVSLHPSSHPTHVAKFHPTIGNQLITGSDDRILRLYDISQTTKGPIVEFDGSHHSDYIRSANFIPGNPNLIATGCYDGIVRLFDTRNSSHQVVSQFNQHNPIEDVLAISSTTLVSAGGPQVRIWDLTRGAQIHELNNFTKTATCLHNTGDRGLLVGSLDGHVKIFDYTSSNWDVQFGWKFGSGGVLSCGVSPASNDHKHFVAGLTSGLISIRTKKTEPKVKQGVKQEKSAAYARMMKGRDYAGEEEHRIIQSNAPQTKKLKQFEKHLNAFRWAEALDSAFAPGLPKEQTVTILNELKKRGKVRISLYGRDEISLLPILQWFTKNLEDVRSFNLLCDYTGIILEMYGSLLDKSVVLEECFSNLLKRINIEIRKCKEANEISGMLELLTA